MAQDEHWTCDVDVFSPDRSVRLIADRTGHLHVDVQNLHRHDETSLAGQIRSAARVALAALQDDPSAGGSDADEARR
ncbi:hypothetical protein [Mangrovihabitans endophyticus]|uniref:Uncharacterized protein n=1 Tax=Mangrovihabitans endophyticus TaxID=1751298 RepID=A0A8J3C055_9ACTN|nr:hypothetical protein [Mangrovihabitans endophyticus]GGK99741.1 hypothetical protein GCM10012284_37670 [Mangrovihabitans endophyticus]